MIFIVFIQEHYDFNRQSSKVWLPMGESTVMKQIASFVRRAKLLSRVRELYASIKRQHAAQCENHQLADNHLKSDYQRITTT